MALSIFYSIAGLPLHPLIVHFVVVLLPLSALALVAIVIVPAWADRYGWLVLAGLTAGTGAALVARQAGEALAKEVGRPVTHARWGGTVVILSLLLLVVAAIWFFMRRRESAAGDQRGRASLVVGILAAVLAVGVTGVVVLAGHSGSKAVWTKVLASSGPTRTPAPATPAVTTPSPTKSKPTSGYTMVEVAQHADATSCWTAIDGQVYDVTAWIDQHPGGPDHILPLCGTDGSDAFHAQHDGRARPEQELEQFLLGSLR